MKDKTPNHELRLVTSSFARLLVLLLLLLPCIVQAQFSYTTNNGAITITRYTGTGGAVTVPGTINSLPVTGIGFEAFDATSVTSVTIPASVTNIIADAFGNCSNLTWIAVDALNSSYSSVDGVLFNKSQTTLIQFPGARVGSYMIPSSVIKIEDDAFDTCYKLTSINLANVTSAM